MAFVLANFVTLNHLKVDKGSMLQEKQLFNSAIMGEKVDRTADFDCINLTVKFRYWSCKDAWRNQKKLDVVLKKFK